jgi:hypothetical protein
MRYLCTLIAWGLIVLVVPPVYADDPFDSRECRSNCVFRYNVRFEWGGGVILPNDSERREGYLKCIQKCNKELWDDMSGPGGN